MTNLGGRDEPRRGDDHGELLSQLEAHDLALATEPASGSAEAFDPETPLTVQVARDDDFTDIVYDGVMTDDESVCAHDYTVKVDLDGQLDPDTEYRYRFVFDGAASRTGTCRTLP